MATANGKKIGGRKKGTPNKSSGSLMDLAFLMLFAQPSVLRLRKKDRFVRLNPMCGYKKTSGWMGGVVCFVLLAQLAEGAKYRQTYVMCRQKKVVRTIRVEVSAGEEKSNCKTFYTKGGTDREVSSGIYTHSCMRVVDNIRGNLEAAHWRCWDINSKAKISTPKTVASESRLDSSLKKESVSDQL